jgi:hypothetical protein
MKKKVLHSLLLTGAMGLFALSATAQQGLTDKKTHPINALVEDYTGATCGWCPPGAIITEDLKNANPGRAYVMAIHWGPFTGGDKFLNPAAEALFKLADSPGSKPTGTVNRQLSSNKRTYGRTSWKRMAEDVINANTPSPINIGIKAVQTGSNIEIDVETYFVETVFKDVRVQTFVLQSGYTSDQDDYTIPAPKKWTGDYVNNDCLRWMPGTDASGETLSKTEKDDFKAFKYTCPIDPLWAGKSTDVITYSVLVVATDGIEGEVLQVIVVELEPGFSEGETGASTQARFFPNGTTESSEEWAGIKTGVENAVKTASLNVYPNPLNGNSVFELNLDNNTNVSYEIINTLGEKIVSEDLGNINGNVVVPVSDEVTSVSGNYILRVQLNNEVITRQLSVK